MSDYRKLVFMWLVLQCCAGMNQLFVVAFCFFFKEETDKDCQNLSFLISHTTLPIFTHLYFISLPFLHCPSSSPHTQSLHSLPASPVRCPLFKHLPSPPPPWPSHCRPSFSPSPLVASINSCPASPSRTSAPQSSLFRSWLWGRLLTKNAACSSSQQASPSQRWWRS